MQIGAPVTSFSNFNYSGPNQAQISADNQDAIDDGLQGGFSLADILTANDKQLTGYNPGSGKINQAAIALANYRYSGAVTGAVTSQFVDAINNSIATTGGYPMNPASLTQPSGSSNVLSPETASALFSLTTGSNAASFS